MVILDGKHETVLAMIISMAHTSFLQQQTDTLGVSVGSSTEKWMLLYNHKKSGLLKMQNK